MILLCWWEIDWLIAWSIDWLIAGRWWLARRWALAADWLLAGGCLLEVGLAGCWLAAGWWLADGNGIKTKPAPESAGVSVKKPPGCERFPLSCILAPLFAWIHICDPYVIFPCLVPRPSVPITLFHFLIPAPMPCTHGNWSIQKEKATNATQEYNIKPCPTVPL